jgi:DNA processing protein
MLTVAAALDRGIDVLAVPGPVHSPASAGVNQLLSEGCGVVRGAEDVLDALGEVRPPAGAPAPIGAGPAPLTEGGALTAEEERVLTAVDWTPTATAVVVARTGLALGVAGALLRRLEDRALVAGGNGWWERRTGGR